MNDSNIVKKSQLQSDSADDELIGNMIATLPATRISNDNSNQGAHDEAGNSMKNNDANSCVIGNSRDCTRNTSSTSGNGGGKAVDTPKSARCHATPGGNKIVNKEEQ